MGKESKMNDLAWLQQWTELVSSADTVAEFGRRLVHSRISPPTAVGAHVYQLDSRGQIDLLGGYGLNPLPQTKVYAWDDNILAESIKTRSLVHDVVELEGESYHVYSLAIMKGDEPLGTTVVSQRQPADREYGPELHSAMMQVLGLWLQSLGLHKDWKPNGNGNGHNVDPSPESLTERQLTVLELMSQGKTNAEIAQELILSESSIRQETVKIYRALGVGSRSEATKRAIHLGILRAPAL